MDINTVSSVSRDDRPPVVGKSACNGSAFQGNCGGVAAGDVGTSGGTMLVNLHLWEAPVRNLDWVTSAFGYR